MNKELSAQAKAALKHPSFESEAGMCQKFTRQCIQAVYGSRFDKYFEGSAYLTMLAFRRSPYAVSPESGSVVGDILYKGRKTSGKHGHVGIRIAGNCVAENSSSHVDPDSGDRDARGTRSINGFGAYELIVRLPAPGKK